MADLTNRPIDHNKQIESMSSLGTAFFAELAVSKSLLGIFFPFSLATVSKKLSRTNPWLHHLALSLCIKYYTVKILKFGTPQTIATIVLKIEKFDVTLH